jgi:beta-lactamase regulating signal transducer with metallopeptidase domain
MNVFAGWFSLWWDAIGWTILHFLWIGAVIGFVSALLRWTVRRQAPEIRYAVSLATLAIMASASACFFVWTLGHRGAASGTVASGTAITGVTTREEARSGRASSADGLTPDLVPSRKAALNHLSTTPSAAGAGSVEALLPTNARKPASLIERIQRQLRDRFAGASDTVLHRLPWLWIVGFPLTCLWLLSGIAGAERLRRQCCRPNDDCLRASCRRSQDLLHVSGEVAVGISDRISGPILVGIVRPMIVLPTTALAGWSPLQVEMILLHEIAHIRRWDNLVNLLQRMMEAVLFFHPAVWWLSNRVRLEREHCCDAVVLAHTHSPEPYAEMLAQIAVPELARPGAVGVSATGQLVVRIRHILKQEDQPMQVSRILITVACGLFISLVGLAMSWAKSDPGDVRIALADRQQQLSDGRPSLQASERASSAAGPIQPSTDPYGQVEPKNAQRVPPPVDRSVLSGRVVLRSDPRRGVPRARILVVPENSKAVFQSAVCDDQGRFRTMRPTVASLVLAQNDDRSFSGIARIRTDDPSVVISVGATSSAHGRLIDETTGQPLAQCLVDYGFVVDGQRISLAQSGKMMFCGAATTNADGEFTLTQLAPAWNYEMSSPTAILWDHGMGQVLHGPKTLGRFKSQETGTLELGNVKVTRSSYPNMLTVTDFIKEAMRHSTPIDELVKSKLEHARLADQRLLIVVGSPKDEICQSVMQSSVAGYLAGLRLQGAASGVLDTSHSSKDDPVEATLADYAVLGFDRDDSRSAAESAAFLGRQKIPMPAHEDTILAVIDVDGSLISSITGAQISAGKPTASAQLGRWLRRNAAPLPDAEQLLADALAQAKRENKRVLVRRSSAHCDPCERLTRYLDSYKSLIEKDYVCVKLDARFFKFKEARNSIDGYTDSGNPWMAILNSDGKPLVTSDGPQGNVGFPESAQEVSYFEWMLRGTAQRLNDREITTLIAPLIRKR